MTVAPARQGLVPDSAILVQITAGLADGGDPTALLQRFLAPIVQVCGAAAGAMRVLSANGQRFELVGDLGLPEAVRAAEHSVGIGCGVCGSAAGSRDVVWTDDLAPCTRRTHDDFFGTGCTRVLAVPLAHRGRLFGVCNLFFTADAVVALTQHDPTRSLVQHNRGFHALMRDGVPVRL